MKITDGKIIFWALVFYYWLLEVLDYFLKDYNHRNEYKFSTSTYIIIFSIVLVIIFVFVLKHTQETDRFIRYAKSFAYGVFFGFFSLLFVLLAKDQTGFYLNKIYPKQEFTEEFEIIHRMRSDGDNIVGLKSVKDKIWFSTTNKFSIDDLIYIQKNDTIKIEYGIGLLNKPYLPFGKLEIIK